MALALKTDDRYALIELTTERLRLEALRPDHTQRVYPALQAPEIYRYLPEDPPTAEALQRRYDFLSKGLSPDGTERWLNWVAFRRTSEEPIGTLQATLLPDGTGRFAYIVFPPFWRQGLAGEMSRALLDELFTHQGIHTLSAEIDTRNIASIRLVESLGMKQVSIQKAADFFKGASSDEYRYSITATAWLQRHSSEP